MIPTIEFEIDGYRCATNKFAAVEALFLQLELMKTIGPAFLQMTGADPEADVSTLAPALRTLFANDVAAMVGVARQLLKLTSVVVAQERHHLGTDAGFNSAFEKMGGFNLGFLIKLLVHVVKTNFGNFFDGK